MTHLKSFYIVIFCVFYQRKYYFWEVDKCRVKDTNIQNVTWHNIILKLLKKYLFVELYGPGCEDMIKKVVEKNLPFRGVEGESDGVLNLL